MSLLAPWFLLGALLIGGPLLAHLVRRATRERVAFSATRWLEPTAPRLSRRSRVQDPWLLLLRLLIVLLLVFGFARPFFPADSTNDAATSGPPPRHVIVVLDQSASLRRGELWNEARDQVRTLAGKLRPEDRFVLLAASAAVVPLIDAERWAATPPSNRSALVASVLADREPTWAPPASTPRSKPRLTSSPASPKRPTGRARARSCWFPIFMPARGSRASPAGSGPPAAA